MEIKKLRNAGKIHPLIATAAASVIVVSLVGVAAITGLFPSTDSTTKPAVEPVAVAPVLPEKKPAPVNHARPTSAPANHITAKTTQATQTPQKTQMTAATPACENCGKVTGVRSIEQAAKPSGVGVVAGAVLGGVLGNQVGGGSGKTLATVAGAAAGGYAGNEVEKRTRKTTTYEVDVSMEDGTSRSFPFEVLPVWKAGDRVRMVNGTLEAR